MLTIDNKTIANFYVGKFNNNELINIRTSVSNIIASEEFKTILNDYRYVINTINTIDIECGIQLPINEILVFVYNKIDFVVFNECYIKTDIIDTETILGCSNMYNSLCLNIKRPISPYANSIMIEERL